MGLSDLKSELNENGALVSCTVQHEALVGLHYLFQRITYRTDLCSKVLPCACCLQILFQNHGAERK